MYCTVDDLFVELFCFCGRHWAVFSKDRPLPRHAGYGSSWRGTRGLAGSGKMLQSQASEWRFAKTPFPIGHERCESLECKCVLSLSHPEYEWVKHKPVRNP